MMKTRRDRSAQNVPVVGWQEGADIQDVLLFGAVQVTDVATTDGFGVFTTTKKPLLDVSHDWTTDQDGTPRERRIDGADITARRTSDNAVLYVGEVDPVAGTVTLYTDEAKTTRAANTTAQVTYWTPVPVRFDQNGQLQAVVAGPLSGAGNVQVAVAESLPAGSNKIGSVDIATALPAGNNIVGKVIIRNTADGGGEDNSVRIRDSAAGNPLTVIAYNADSKPIPTNGFPLAVSELPWLYNGDGTASRVRNARFFRAATATAQGVTTVWTPAAGKIVALRGFFLAADGAVTVQFTVGGTPVDPKIPLAAGVPVSVVLPNVWMPGGAGQAIGVSLSGAATVGVLLFGTEE